MDDFFRANLPKLKGSEAKLILTLLHVPEARNSKSELMRLSGVTDRVTFYRAWRGLEESGWVAWVYDGGEVLQNPTGLLQFPTTRVAKPDYPVAKPDQDVAKTTREMQQMLQDPTDVVSMNFEVAFELADAMDASGVQTSLKSPYQQRRKKQCVLLQEAWAELFPKDPVDPQAFTLLLQAAHDSSSEVYRAMLEASLRKVEHPKAYILAILKSPKKQQPASDPEVLRPVTEEQRKAWQDNEKQLAGVLSGWSF